MTHSRNCLAALFALLLAACATVHQPRGADLVFIHGAVYTVSREQPWANAVAVSGGRITYVGNNPGARKFIGPTTRVIDLHGRMLLPGFHDSHMHPMAAGTRFMRCQLQDLAWPEAVLQELSECAARLGPGEWLRGIGLAGRVLENPAPNKSLIDPFTPDIPAIIELGEANSFWVNGKSLKLAGITAATPEVINGRIEREPVSNEPTGILRASAASPVYDLIPPESTARLREALKRASEMANSLGITSSNEASARQEHIEAYLEADAANELTMRVQAAQRWDGDKGAEQVAQLVKNHQRSKSNRFSAGSVKFFLDGDLYWKSAALLQPYAGSEDTRGQLTYASEILQQYVQDLDNQGMDVHMHAYGDAAVRQGLDAVEYAIKNNPARDRRAQLAHLALVAPADFGRFAALGVTADIQPNWFYVNRERETEIENAGPERATRLMPAQSFFRSGARVVAGSDWISASMNPLDAIQIAVTRQPLDGSGEAWNHDERVTLDQMLEAYTINGAWLARMENATGSVEVGKFADLVVLDRNLFEIEPTAISSARVMLTFLEGKEVFRDPAER